MRSLTNCQPEKVARIDFGALISMCHFLQDQPHSYYDPPLTVEPVKQPVAETAAKAKRAGRNFQQVV
jgi:hypothetical protein